MLPFGWFNYNINEITPARSFISTVTHNCHDNNKHTYKKGLPPYKQDLLAYTKKNLLINTKNPRQIATANSSGKFPRRILKYAIQKMVWGNPLCARASRVKIKKTSNKTFLKLVLAENDWQLFFCCINYPITIQKKCPIWI